MGDMARDAFYMLDNQVILDCLDSAVNAHQNWLNTLKEIARATVLFSTRFSRCAFFGFYSKIRICSLDKVPMAWISSLKSEISSLEQASALL